MEILGGPELTLALKSDKSMAMVAARLSDVDPSGRATRVTYGVLNLTHRNSDENPKELVPGEKYYVTLKLNHIAQRFPAGHQVRISISTSYWPLVWPSPEPARLTICPNESSLHLPARRGNSMDDQLKDFGKPDIKSGMETTLLAPAKREWEVVHNLASNLVTLEVTNNDAQLILDDIDWTIQKDVTEKYSYQAYNYDFLPALKVSEMRQIECYDIAELLKICTDRIEKNGTIDAIVSYYDFPGTTLLPIMFRFPVKSKKTIIRPSLLAPHLSNWRLKRGVRSQFQFPSISQT